MPKTWEDWVTVWKAFAKEDANGNGDPNDEVPFAVSHQFFKFVLNMFGMQSNGEFSVVDGEYLYDPEIQIMKIPRQHERAVCGRNFTERICNAGRRGL